MVLSSQTITNEQTRHLFGTDIAACVGNLAGAAVTGALGCNSLTLSSPKKMFGDTDTGHMATCTALPFLKRRGGCWERYNLLPTGGRQCNGNIASGNELTQGDDLGGASERGLGAVALEGASSQGRRIAQASNGNQYGCCGVFNFAYGQVKGVSGQNRVDTFGLPRGMEYTQAGKGAVRNIWPPKAQK